jgi:hypothetical protein
MTHTRLAPLLLVALALGLSACGSSSSKKDTTSTATKPASTTASTPSSTDTASTSAASLAAAANPSLKQFPATRGRTLTQMTKGLTPVGDVAPATGTFVPGSQRFGFELLDKQQKFVYGPTAVYIAKGPGSPARGPFLAPADSLTVAPEFRSQATKAGGEPPAVLAADVPVPKAGTWSILTLTKVGGKLLGGATQLAARASTPIPGPGDVAPVIDTLTPATAGGKLSLVTTRIPPDDMNAISAKSVLGKKPVALLFSTPALCQSRVCGPVTDVVVALEKRFRGRITFIHQEVYVNNNPVKGYRPQMKAYHLQTEPWLFTIDRHGRVAARLEGAFGRNAVIAALKAALR